jgi:hypothetical protein
LPSQFGGTPGYHTRLQRLQLAVSTANTCYYANLGNPTQTTRPADPTNSLNPTNPFNRSQPVNSGQPANPANPAMSDLHLVGYDHPVGPALGGLESLWVEEKPTSSSGFPGQQAERGLYARLRRACTTVRRGRQIQHPYPAPCGPYQHKRDPERLQDVL